MPTFATSDTWGSDPARDTGARSRGSAGVGGGGGAGGPRDRSAREVRGVLSQIRFHSPSTGFVIAVLRGGDCVKGTLAEPAVGLEYHLIAGSRGGWQHDARYGWTFAFDDARPLVPTTNEGVGEYLLAHAPWIGRSVVKRVLEAFGDTALTVLKSDPARVARDVRGLTRERADEIQAALVAREAVEAVEVEVRSVVAAAEVTGRQIRAILDRHGSESAAVVRANPYRLIEEIDGIAWATADRIATAVGVDRRDPARIRAGVLTALREAEDKSGCTCAPYSVLVGEACTLLSLDPATVEARVVTMIPEGDLVNLARDGAPEPLIFRAELFAAERAIASGVVQLLAPARAPCTDAPALDPLACLEGLSAA